MKPDRGFIKWQPFDSVTSSKAMVKKLLIEKSKVDKPVMSDEQKEVIENKIMDAFYANMAVNVVYYRNGFMINTKNKIKKIDSIYKRIYLDNGLILYFNQIINVGN